MIRSHVTVFAAAIAAAFLFSATLTAVPASADSKYKRGSLFSKHSKSDQYRKTRPQVRGYKRRVGGYSYDYLESGGALEILPDQGGPFDSGYFFDSAFGTVGGDAPYFH